MLLHGNLGYSLSLGNVPVTHIIAQHMWWTIVLVGLVDGDQFRRRYRYRHACGLAARLVA